MQLFAILLSIMLLAFTTPMVTAGPFSVRDSIPEGYELANMGFHGDIAGHDINYNGTIEEILAHAETMYPGITKSLAARDDVPLANISELALTNIAGRSALTFSGGPDDGKGRRGCGEGSKECPFCGDKKWGWAQKVKIEDGIRYLNKVTAVCSAPERKLEELLLLPCNWVSTFAQDIIDDDACTYKHNDGSFWQGKYFSGQQFAEKVAYNTYVAWGNC